MVYRVARGVPSIIRTPVQSRIREFFFCPLGTRAVPRSSACSASLISLSTLER